MITIEDQITEVKREIGFRRSVYRKKVANNSMTQAEMDKRIQTMVAVLETLQSLAPTKQQKLF